MSQMRLKMSAASLDLEKLLRHNGMKLSSTVVVGQKKNKNKEDMKKTIMNKMGKYLIPTTAAGIVLCASTAFGALTTVNNGAGDISLTGATDGNADAFGGAGYLATSGAQAYSYDGGADTGTLNSFVYAAGVDPLNTLGGLTFVYVLSVNSNPNLLLGELQIGSTSSGSSWGSTVVMGYGSPGTAAAPVSGSLNLNSILNFKWSPESTTSGTYYLVVGTSLKTYEGSTATVQDGGSTPNLSVLAPAAVPEASTVMAGALMLLPLGIGAVRALRKERTA